jgi:hypothetical protein
MTTDFPPDGLQDDLMASFASNSVFVVLWSDPQEDSFWVSLRLSISPPTRGKVMLGGHTRPELWHIFVASLL